ncbi:toxin [Chitinimonas arctica]|uniref:Toxin n=1 Tax=Chitinimonas arctica TaxID=2594795 RepID=A0A516SJY6_9NEIS|nr:zeta toxin family protein [Chitinimonas arctica]QDQ28467.1 toxin [Chitinimonas arctica]
MTTPDKAVDAFLKTAVDAVLDAQRQSEKPLAIVLAGHNGSGKSTMWYLQLADKLQVPLVNADRMMLSILPEVNQNQHLPAWAARLRDNDTSWMKVAQMGVEAFVAQAMLHGIPFAMETVFSHWRRQEDGSFESKIRKIEEMQEAGYFVLLFFVGLSDEQLSIARVSTRVIAGGHNVDVEKLVQRFPRTQKAIRQAVKVADAAILTDNSRERSDAFTVCRIQMRDKVVYDRRISETDTPKVIRNWLDIVCPLPT